MARAFKCDCCGGYYDEPEINWPPNEETGIMRRRASIIRVFSLGGEVICDKHLCKECFADLYAFLHPNVPIIKEEETC